MDSKDFDKIYKKVYSKCVNKSYEKYMKKLEIDQNEKIDKATYFSFFLMGLCSLLCMYFMGQHNLIGFLLSSILFGLAMVPSTLSVKTKKKYNNLDYKANVLNALLSIYDSSLQFSSTKGMNKELYSNAEFGRYDVYNSTEHAFGFLDNVIPIQFGYTFTQNKNIEKEMSNGHYGIFQGLFSVVKLPVDTENVLKIHQNFDKGNLQMDSEKFEDYFDVYTIDQNLAMRILTSDIMNYLIELSENFRFEMTIKKNFIYIRLYSREKVLEGLDQNHCINYDILYNDYNFISTICELNKKIYYSIQEKDI